MHDLDLTISSSGLELAATLTRPEGTEPQTAALLISGSGPIDRDSNTKRLRIDVMHQMARGLAASGIASLRYDKRGVGASEGDYLSTGFDDNVRDARAALDVLRRRPEVDAGRVVVVGHSEGALIAAQLAADSDLAGVVLLAGTARNGKDVLQWQARRLIPTLPAPVRWITKLLRIDLVRTQSKRLARIEASTEDVIRIQFVKINARWFREFMAFDPATALSHAAVPVLAATGSKDIQVDPADVAVMDQLVPTDFTGHVLDDVTHLLRTEAGPASIRTYKKQVRRPIDSDVIDTTTAWIAERTRAANGATR